MKNIKMSVSEKLDFQRFQKLPIERQKCFEEASSKPILSDTPINQLSRQLHPAFFQVRVKEIIEETHDTKTFVLEPDEAKGFLKFPNYQPGQYITLEVPIDSGIYRRAYTISCSPKSLSKNQMNITIKTVSKGLVSNYFFHEVQVGDSFLARGPFGDFVYQPLRDSSSVLAVVGGSGITPIMAMAESIADGILTFDLTILYGAKTKKDFIFKERLDELASVNEHIKVIYLLSEEEDSEYIKGFVTKELIQEYASDDTSYFVCGPIALYETMNHILTELAVSNKYVRHDLYPHHEVGVQEETYELRVLTEDCEKVILCKGTETIMAALERNGIRAPKRCGVGICGFCRSKLLQGEILMNEQFIRLADRKYRYFHPCAAYPLSDLKIQLPK